MPPPDRDELYIGWQAHMPPRLARFTTFCVIALLAGAAVLSFIIPALHENYAFARSDFTDIRTFEGILLAEPAPHIVIVRPGKTGARAFSRYVLVGRGKSGPRIDTVALHGQQVKLTGSLIYRDAQTLIAVKSAEAVAAAQTDPVLASSTAIDGEALGRFTLQGEIIDSKCYYGTMRPGNGAVHRSCAVRCIAGGVPPVFLTRDEHGNTMSFLLVAADGSSVNQQVLPLVADPVEINGDVIRMDDVFVLLADPATYRRL